MLESISDCGKRSSWRLLQDGQTASFTGDASVISASQPRQLNCMIRLIKPLILLLLFAISAKAQSLPEVARQERERKANLKPTRALTTDTTKSQPAEAIAPTPDKAVDTNSKTATTTAGAKSAEPPKAAATASTSPSGPVESEAAKKYAEELARLRTRVVQLQDQETSLRLQLNDLKNAFLAPVTDTDARAQAQNQIDQAQTQLAETQRELAETRRQVQILEAQGPPRP